jgi:hypothetical protein
MATWRVVSQICPIAIRIRVAATDRGQRSAPFDCRIGSILRKARRWNGGAVAFIDVGEGRQSVFGRGCLVTFDQFTDIARQENGL